MIKFFVPGQLEKTSGRASVRFRALVPLKGMGDKGGIIDDITKATKDDIIVCAKIVDMDILNHLINNGIKYVFDICDDKWNKEKKLYDFACRNANLVTTTCELLQSKIKEYTGKTAFIIPDPTEREQEEPKFEPKDHIKFAWFGGRKSFSLFDWEEVIESIKTVTDNFSIHAITNKPDKASKRLIKYREDKKLVMYPWSFDKQGEVVRDCDIVLLPIPRGMPLVQVKSPNRVIDRIKQGQIYINKNHSPQTVGQRWIETEKLV